MAVTNPDERAIEAQPGRAAPGSSMPPLLRRIGDVLLDWRVARMRVRPTSRRAALRLGQRLIDLRRFDEADAVLSAGIAAWPGRPRLLYLHAMSAHAAGRYDDALARWQALRHVDATEVWGWCGISANARALGDLKLAEETVCEALVRFPDDLGVASEAASTFDRVGRHHESAIQWRRLRALAPGLPDWHRAFARSLVMTHRFEEAEAILDLGDACHPDDLGLLATRAMLAMEREDWNAALALWRVYRERRPTDQTGWEGQGKTIAAIHAARAEAFDEQADVAKVDIELVEDDPVRKLLLGFESIGANCEFGLVQRRFGAEPLGLLRFNDVRLPSLIAALEAGFDAMGEPSNTTLRTSSSGEFYVADRRWDLGMHTFLFDSGHAGAALFPKMCRRVAYLRDKLREDLSAGEKVFVFKSDAIDLDGLRRLHAALRAHGPVRLLHVRRASVPLADRPFAVAPGEVYRLDEDLFVGFLGRMGNGTGRGWDIAFDDWIAICGGVGESAPPLP